MPESAEVGIEVISSFCTFECQVRRFFGLAYNYQEFIKGFSAIIAPIHLIFTEISGFEEGSNPFDELKDALRSAQVYLS
jgi:hypothetical protein